MSYVFAGIGAGLVSALLFAVVITGSPLALLLSYAAPLPVFIAALGWRHRAGLVAAIAGAIGLFLALRYQAGLAFAIGIALPAWGIAYLALLGRSDERGQTEWYPLGRLMLWMAGTAALVTVVGAMAIAGSHEAYTTAMQRSIAAVLSGQVPGFQPMRLPATMSVDEVASALATWAPFLAGASFVPMLAANLWMAAKAVHLSGRLPRPWPTIPSLNLPREALGVMLAAIVLSFVPGFAGFFGMAVLGALSSAFLLNGLAGIHEMSAGRPMRGGLLFALYLGLMVGATILAPLIAIFGFLDCILRIRARRQPPPPFTPTT
ncbi:MAG: DUF2232 domain-containing protein [Hyphomicrobiales bacterium]|nr:DUF2232 domain-containing protein [Hyphomicrobiales bacterium]